MFQSYEVDMICYRQTDRQTDNYGETICIFLPEGGDNNLCVAKMLPEWQTVNTLISIPLAQALLSRYTGSLR